MMKWECGILTRNQRSTKIMANLCQVEQRIKGLLAALVVSSDGVSVIVRAVMDGSMPCSRPGCRKINSEKATQLK